MRYLRVEWIHSDPTEPVHLYSELDGQDWEVRKVEVYSDGRMDFAGLGEETGSTFLGLEALPPIEEIAADPQFKPSEISKEEFEAVWEKALARKPGRKRRGRTQDDASLAS